MTKKRFPFWTIGLVGILLLILVPVLYFLPRSQTKNNPAAYIPEKPAHVDHTPRMLEPGITAQAVLITKVEQPRAD
jgi:hypothetical protein